MALSIDQVQAITNKYWMPTLTNNIYSFSALWTRLYQNGPKRDGGEKIHVPLEYAAVNGGSFTKGDTLTIADVASYTAATFDWSFYFGVANIDVTDQAKNMGNAAVVDLVFAKMNSGQNKLMSDLGTDLFLDGTGNTNKALDGLDLICSATATLGGVAVADMATWVGTTTTTTEALSPSVLRTLRRAALFSEGQPTIIVTTPALFDAIRSFITPNQQLTDSELAKFGFKSVEFEGLTVVTDLKCPSGTLYMIDEKHVDVTSHSTYNFKQTGWIEAQDKTTMVNKIWWFGNMTCSHRRSNAKHTNLS